MKRSTIRLYSGDMLVLSALGDGGWHTTDEIRRKAGTPNAQFKIISRLLYADLIEREALGSTWPGGKPRYHYRINDAGRRALEPTQTQHISIWREVLVV